MQRTIISLEPEERDWLAHRAQVEHVPQTVLADQAFDETAVPVWEQLSAIGESAPEGTWDSVPTDLSIRLGLVDDCVERRRQGVGR